MRRLPATRLHVFPSPVKGLLQEQLKDPTVFVHAAEL